MTSPPVRSRRFAARVALLAVVALAAGCGSGDGADNHLEATDDASSPAGETPDDAPDPDDADNDVEQSNDGDGDEPDPSFPVTIDGELAPDEQAAADAWAVVFDSETSRDDKAPHLEAADELASTIEAYAAAGSDMGGISLAPTGVAIDGDTATVTYDVLFGGSAAYTALTGTMTVVDDTWTVGRDEFCGFMASARTPCP